MKHSTQIMGVLNVLLGLMLVVNSCRQKSTDPEPGADRIITFSGYNWIVKHHASPAGPGKNYWSNSRENVWVDAEGQLHLRITKRNGIWYCAEVSTEQSFGYREYVFYVASRIDQLDKNVVGALFTYLDDDHEIDIEFSRRDQADADNAQYVVQPYYHSGNVKRFKMQLNGDYTTHRIDWHSDHINFRSLHGHYANPPGPGHVIQEWIYTGDDIPPASNEKVHMNLWLVNGQSPSDGQEAEMVIKRFELR